MYSKPDESFSVGDVVEWNDMMFLVTDIDEDQQIQTKGTIQLCNNTLNMYINDTLYEIPCIVESNTRLYQLGTDDNKFISEPSTNIIVRVPKNSISLLIERDQIYQLGVNNYKIVDISDIIEQGLLVFKLEFSQEEQYISSYSIDILNGVEANIQINSTLQLNVQVVKDYEILSTIPSFVFSCNNSVCSVDSNGLVTAKSIGNCIITVSLTSDSNVNDSINVNVIAEQQNNYTVNILGDYSIVKDYNKEYSCEFKNNGSSIIKESTFWLTGTDNQSTTLATIISQDSINNTCVIDSNTLGYVKLWVKSVDEQIIIPDGILIKIKNLF